MLETEAPHEGDLVHRARGLRELIEREADATDRALTLTPPLVEAFAAARLFHVMVPRELGGLEATSDQLLDVFEELAYADGSVGWSLMANASANAYLAYLDRAAGTAAAAKPGSTIAGQFSPLGRIVREDGGFRVSGSFQFGSGSDHAAYLGGAGFVLGPEDQPEIGPDGLPVYLVFFVPRDGVVFKGNWDVMGLRGTGSFDYDVKEQFVEAGWTFPIFGFDVRSGGPLFGIGPIALAGIGHAGWGLGVARRALDEVARIAAAGRARMGATPLKDQQVFQRELGQKALALRSVRLLARDAFARAVEQVRQSGPLTFAAVPELMAMTAYLTEVAEDATLFAYRFAGSQGLRNPSVVQRCFRDVMTGGLHFYVDRKSYEEVGKRILADAAV
jgi:indole-3-acetate monooxygenase